MNKGNVLVIVAVLVTVVLLGGFYLKTKGKINLPINTSMADRKDITSDKMKLTVSANEQGMLTGKTSPFAEIFVNEQETKADKDGNFSLKLDLVDGENNVIVNANDSDGNVVEQNLTINYVQQ